MNDDKALMTQVLLEFCLYGEDKPESKEMQWECITTPIRKISECPRDKKPRPLHFENEFVGFVKVKYKQKELTVSVASANMHMHIYIHKHSDLMLHLFDGKHVIPGQQE